jgi:hypothetical protein
MYFHFHCNNLGYDLISNLFKRTAIEEMMHVEKLAERILFLKGEVEMKASHDVQKIHDVKKMLETAAGMETGWLMPLIAVAEIAGGLLFITNKYRVLGAIFIFPVMIGILLTHILIAPSGLPIALILLAINLWVIIENREKYLPMIK